MKTHANYMSQKNLIPSHTVKGGNMHFHIVINEKISSFDNKEKT